MSTEDHDEVPPAEEEEQAAEKVGETEALKAAMRSTNDAEGYDGKKQCAQVLKELLVREPGVINNEAGKMKSQARDIGDAVEQRKKEQSEFTEAMNDLKEQTEALRNDNAADRVEKKKILLVEEQNKRKQYLESVETAQAGGQKPFESTDIGTRYVTFLTTRGDLLMKVEMQRTRYTQLCEMGLVKNAATDDVMDDLRTDEQNNIRCGMELEKLQALAVELKEDGWNHDLDVKTLAEQYDEAKAVLAKWKDVVLDEVKHQSELAKRIETFMEEQQSLLTWITNQQQNLKMLSKPSDIVEFCTSLHELVNTMEENITVLQDMSEAHLPNKQITSALMDLSNAWVKLQITSYEMLLKTLMEQHAASQLKESVVAFSGWQRGDLKQLLDDAEDLLQTPENPREKELVASALEFCKELQTEYQPHLLLMDHLADFEVRMELIEDQYHPMLTTILSTLTALCQKIRLSTPPSWQGKQTYEKDMNKIHQWIETRDTDTTAWEIAKDKVSKLCVTLDQ
eukprot:TRINITY_DN13210_c0_g1_i1.p1 TRINITY_DN13210_c0_g1~~TRINITY_DN13210_c0_g1_i1.p1  ORF type:complete len:529 (+),score=202.67 TRINITY_DN13210_c0_g1_i1:57-1589(+)